MRYVMLFKVALALDIISGPEVNIAMFVVDYGYLLYFWCCG